MPQNGYANVVRVSVGSQRAIYSLCVSPGSGGRAVSNSGARVISSTDDPAG